MSQVEVFECRRPILGINSLGRIGKLTLWHHIGRKYFQEIVVNVGRGVGSGLSAIAQVIEKDTTYGSIHRFLYGVKAKRMIQIVDEKNRPMFELGRARHPSQPNHGIIIRIGNRMSVTWAFPASGQEQWVFVCHDAISWGRTEREG
jgi:hypothetical protein